MEELHDRINYSLDPQLGWGDLVTGGLEIHQVSGDHLSMLQDPHVQGLAEKLRDCLRKALAMSTGSSETPVPHISSEGMAAQELRASGTL